MLVRFFFAIICICFLPEAIAMSRIEVKPLVIMESISGRISRNECGRPYHKYNDPPKQAQICDVCGGNLIQRDDDREEIVTKRLDVYRSETEPLIEHYSKQKNVLREIDSEVAKEQVFQQVLEALPLVVR